MIKDGKVAVLISPDYGAGWYTWNTEYPDCLFDPMLASLVLEGKMDEAVTYATLRWPEAYLGGLDTLTVKWVPQGTAFRVHEYDGSETLEIKEDLDWFVA